MNRGILQKSKKFPDSNITLRCTNKETIYDTEYNPSIRKTSAGILSLVSGMEFQEEYSTFGLRRLISIRRPEI